MQRQQMAFRIEADPDCAGRCRNDDAEHRQGVRVAHFHGNVDEGGVRWPPAGAQDDPPGFDVGLDDIRQHPAAQHQRDAKMPRHGMQWTHTVGQRGGGQREKTAQQPVRPAQRLVNRQPERKQAGGHQQTLQTSAHGAVFPALSGVTAWT